MLMKELQQVIFSSLIDSYVHGKFIWYYEKTRNECPTYFIYNITWELA